MEDREAGLGWPMSRCHRSGATCPQMQGLTEKDLSGLALCSIYTAVKVVDVRMCFSLSMVSSILGCVDSYAIGYQTGSPDASVSIWYNNFKF